MPYLRFSTEFTSIGLWTELDYLQCFIPHTAVTDGSNVWMYLWQNYKPPTKITSQNLLILTMFLQYEPLSATKLASK